jgi:L-alanine-DL-glutamate epimerase-like enolase superfamily enzyme
VLANVNWQEMVRAYLHGWYGEIATSLPQVADGCVTPLDGPGLGLALRPEVLQRPDTTLRASAL